MGKSRNRKKSNTHVGIQLVTTPSGFADTGVRSAAGVPAVSAAMWQHPWVHLIFLLALTLLAYSNSFNAPWALDDEVVIHNLIKDFSLIADPQKIWQENTFLATQLTFATRVVAFFTFCVNYAWGGLNVVGYHVVNLAIHLVNVLLVYRLIRLIAVTPHFEDPGTVGGLPRGAHFLAFSCALMFALHPIQTGAVTYVAQRITSLCTMFYLGSLVWYLQSRTSRGWPPRVSYVCSLVCALLAMHTKEIAVTLPVMVMLIEFTFFPSGAAESAWRRSRRLIPFLLALAIIPLTLLQSGMARPFAERLQLASSETTGVSRLDYLFTQFGVVVTYLRLLLLPVNQNLDYDIAVQHSLWTPAVWVPCLFLVSLIAMGIVLWLRSWRRGSQANQERLVAFGIAWFFIALALESSIFPITDLMFEHRLYLPGIGFFLCVSSALLWMWRRSSGYGKSIAVIILCLIVPSMGVATWQRNTIWSDSIALWQDVVKKSPMKSRAYANLAAYQLRAHDWPAARASAQSAVRLDAANGRAHFNLGVASARLNRYDEAIEAYRRVLELKTGYVRADDVHGDIGTIYLMQRDFKASVGEFTQALALNPNRANDHYRLGFALQSLSRPAEAETHYLRALALDPQAGYRGALFAELAVVYVMQNRFDEAETSLAKALSLDASLLNARLNLGSLLARRGMHAAALEQFQLVLKIDPQNMPAQTGATQAEAAIARARS